MDERRRLTLDGTWRFAPDPHADGEEHGFWRRAYDAAAWPAAPVPSCFDAGRPEMAGYEGICWYRRTFVLPRDWAGARLVLRFEGVNYRARVWLNDRFLGENTDPFLPFEFDVTAAVGDGENVLAVSVDNAPHPGDVPAEQTQWTALGGILREVFLYTTPPVWLDDLRVIATADGAAGRLAVAARVANAGTAEADAQLVITVTSPDERPCLTLTASGRVPPGGTADLTVAGVVTDAALWSPATPALYRVTATLRADGRDADTLARRIGFRTLIATPTGLRLNGQPLRLKGFNRHEDSPRTAMAADPAQAREDFTRMKAIGANFVRLCHYPHHLGDLDACDELGLLALAEIPLNLQADAARFATAARQLERMIARDAHHPSIAFWSVSNELNEEDPAVATGVRNLVGRARALDPTRLCVHVSHRWHEHPNFAADDVICVNYYPSIRGWRGRRGAGIGDDLGRSFTRWRESLAKLHARFPEKPILITEFGYCSIPGTFGHALGEDLHERVLRAEYPAFDLPYVCGAAVWVWADHPASPHRFFDGMRQSPFGVLTRDRRPKRAFAAICDLFR